MNSQISYLTNFSLYNNFKIKEKFLTNKIISHKIYNIEEFLTDLKFILEFQIFIKLINKY